MGNTITATGGSSQFVNNLRKSSAQTVRALERLSTGKRINRPSDDPSGFVTAELLRSELVRLQAELKTLTSKQHSVRQRQSGLAALQEQLIELRGLITSIGGNLLGDAQRQLYEDQIAESLESIGRLRQRVHAIAPAIADGVDAALRQMTSALDDDGPAQAEKAAVLMEKTADEVVFSRAALATYERYHIETFKQLTQDLNRHAHAGAQPSGRRGLCRGGLGVRRFAGGVARGDSGAGVQRQDAHRAGGATAGLSERCGAAKRTGRAGIIWPAQSRAASPSGRADGCRYSLAASSAISAGSALLSSQG